MTMHVELHSGEIRVVPCTPVYSDRGWRVDVLLPVDAVTPVASVEFVMPNGVPLYWLKVDRVLVPGDSLTIAYDRGTEVLSVGAPTPDGVR